MANRFNFPRETALDANGDPISGAKLNFYESGTTTRLDTFSNNALTTANANPVVADSAGRFGDIFLQASNYKVVLTDADDVTIWTADPVAGTIDATGDEFAPSQQAVPDMTVQLSAGNIFVISSKLYTVVAAQNSASITAPSSDPRRDIVYIDRLTGVVGITTGAEAASPVDPTIPDDKLPVARITLATTTTEIDDSLIDDIRELNELGALDGVNVQTFTSSDTWTKPAGVLRAQVILWSAGGSGAANGAGEGGGGGGGGVAIIGDFAIGDLGATETVTIGSGGAAVASGNDGNVGGNSTFGSLLTAYGGGGGGGGVGGGGGGGGGGGTYAVGSSVTGSVSGGVGGAPQDTAADGSDNVGFGGGNGGDGGATPVPGGQSIYGGGGGGGGDSDGGGSTSDGGASIFGGGGGGGGADSSAGGSGGTSAIGGDGGAGAIDAANATAGTQPGGGGGGSETGNSGAGGDGQCIVISW